jgi:hypothetical protein
MEGSAVSFRFPLEQLASYFNKQGATEVLIKHLVSNNNSKNQIYLPGDISSLSLLPIGELQASEGSSNKIGHSGPIFKAKLDLWWLNEGELCQAPDTKLIVYPQYPEMRLSGFLNRCKNAPSELMDYHKRGREADRVLVLAPLPDKRVIAVLFAPESLEAELIRSAGGEPYGVLRRFDLGGTGQFDSESLLLSELRRIHLKGWLAPEYRRHDGTWAPCRGTNCGGVTLESHLGISANGYAEPDFHGWEIKQHAVPAWGRAGRAITLLTPEPTGGAYVDDGVESFIRSWGYADRKGRNDRLNVGGIYQVGKSASSLTGLRLVLDGYNADREEFTSEGAVLLVDRTDRVAASWTFAKLMNHWKRKHAKAAFVPSMSKKEPDIRYCYGSEIHLGEGGRFSYLLRAFAYGLVYYDPGIKMEGVSGEKPVVKRRSQFRIQGKNLSTIYQKYRAVDLLR